MKKTDWLRPSVISLVLANLVPLVGVLAFGWETFPLLLLFWFENVVVGGFNVLKMLFASPQDLGAWVVKLFQIPFFCFHYGMFTFVHGLFVIAIFGRGFAVPGGPFLEPRAVWQIVTHNHLEWAILGLVISHGISFVHNYLWLGEYRQASAQTLIQ